MALVGHGVSSARCKHTLANENLTQFFGTGQMYIPLNPAAYTPNTLHGNSPRQANQTTGNGFFTAPGRSPSGALQRSLSPTFADVWSQPRLFYNSLHPAERQFLVNGIRFETSQLTSVVVKQNVIVQLNRISNNLARRVARFIGIDAPRPDPRFYHDNTTSVSLGAFGAPLLRLDGLRIGILSSVRGYDAALQLRTALLEQEPSIDVAIVAETQIPGTAGVSTYSGADATGFDGVIVTDIRAEDFEVDSSSPLFPTGRPLQIVLDTYRYGKPIGVVGSPGEIVLDNAGIEKRLRTVENGVFTPSEGNEGFVEEFLDGLRTFRYLSRIAFDEDAEES
jgi:catalase